MMTAADFGKWLAERARAQEGRFDETDMMDAFEKGLAVAGMDEEDVEDRMDEATGSYVMGIGPEP